jgi:hypothetical protein
LFALSERELNIPINTTADHGGQPTNRAERVSATLPLKHGMSESTTLNVSATGVLFSTDEVAELGSTVSFSIEIEIDGNRLNILCEGQVARIEHLDGRRRVAAKIYDSYLEVP